MDKIYVIMWDDIILEDIFYTDEKSVSDRVDSLNNGFSLGHYWYKSLNKADGVK